MSQLVNILLCINKAHMTLARVMNYGPGYGKLHQSIEVQIRSNKTVTGHVTTIELCVKGVHSTPSPQAVKNVTSQFNSNLDSVITTSELVNRMSI